MNTEPLGNWESRLSKLVDDIGRIFEFLSPEVLASFSSLTCSVAGRDRVLLLKQSSRCLLLAGSLIETVCGSTRKQSARAKAIANTPQSADPVDAAH